MKVAEAIANVFKQEGIEQLVCYPRQALIDACAAAGIRPIVCRQERVGAAIADGISRSTYGKKIGVFSMQGGPGIENTFAGVAQVFGDNVPVLFIPGERVGRSYTPPSFDAVLNFRNVTKWAADLSESARLSELLRRAFQNLRSGKPGPVLLEVSSRLADADIADDFDYQPVKQVRAGPDPADVRAVAQILLNASRPVIHAGQGVLYAGATKELVAFSELIQAPVLTTNTGKGAFPEHHPLSLGASVISAPKGVFHFLARADCVIGIGTSFTRNIWAPQVPSGKRIIHATNDPADINKEFATEAPILGDAKLVLEALIAEIGARRRTDHNVAAEVQAIKHEWLAEWMPELTSREVPINQYQIIHELMKALPRESTIVTHNSGSPREQMVAFWECHEPGGYLGWGKTTQLGHGLGLIMGAKLAHPEKTCVNVMGDASIGMVGLDIETAVRNHIGILTIVFNNGVMAGEQNSMQAAVKRYQAADLGGNYSEVARALGAWSVRVSEPDLFRPSLDQALEATRSHVPALIECVAKQNYKFSRY